METPLALTSNGSHRSRWYTSYWNAYLFLQVTSPFSGVTDTPVLGFWRCLTWISRPEWILGLCSALLACHGFFRFRILVPHLPTSWCPAWQLSYFDPRNFLQNCFCRLVSTYKFVHFEAGSSGSTQKGVRAFFLFCKFVFWVHL